MRFGPARAAKRRKPTPGKSSVTQPELKILWQDEAILVVNKPAGLLTIQDGYDPTLPYLSRILREKYGRVWTVHRLDKETSGVILFARSAEAHHNLNDQFANRQIAKAYHALVNGVPKWDEILANFPLRVNGDRRHRTVIDMQHGKPASTSLHVLEKLAKASLIEAYPHSGYTHQVRAHLAYLGFPLLGDELYGGKVASHTTGAIGRTALHAFRLTFVNPLSSESQTIEAPYPTDFLAALDTLRAGK